MHQKKYAYNSISVINKQRETDMYDTNLKILRKPEACALSGLSNTSIFEQTKAGLFPPVIKLGARAAGFLEHEVIAVVTARAAGHTNEQIKSLVNSLVIQRQSAANHLLKKLVA